MADGIGVLLCSLAKVHIALIIFSAFKNVTINTSGLIVYQMCRENLIVNGNFTCLQISSGKKIGNGSTN